MTTGTATGRIDPVPAQRGAPGGPAPEQPPGRDRPLAARLQALPHRLAALARAEALLAAVLAGSFLARWLVADRNSYWLDEILSVALYGIWNDSASDAVDYLGTRSVHPPLYQLILYQWMELFGDDERATRSLSNLYITLATLVVYLLVREAFSRRLGLASAIAFTLMYSPTYYALETRSYAQTIFLATLSSYCLLRVMRAGTTSGNWRQALFSPATAVLLAANSGLLLTHYYNAFFLAAQGAVAALFVLRDQPPREWPAGLGAVSLMSAVPAGVFAFTWGDVLLRTLRRRSGAFPADGAEQTPAGMLGSVVTTNLDPPLLIMWLGLAALVGLAVQAVTTLVRRGGPTVQRQQAWTTTYLIAWLVLPFLAAFVVFTATGVARYETRYWLFILPALAPLLILAVEWAAQLAGQAWHRVRRRSPAPGWGRWAVVGGTATIIALILPGTLTAATQPKADWRGTAQDIVAIVESDPASSYAIYETSFGRDRFLDYYLARYSSEVRLTGTITRRSERGDADFSFDLDAGLIAEHDYLVVAFIHHHPVHFPVALQRLRESYPVHRWQVDETGQGLVIFAVPPRTEQGPPS